MDRSHGTTRTGHTMERDALTAKIEEFMRQYDAGEIDSSTYSEKMLELTRAR